MCKQVPLSRGLFALVSDCDFERVNQYKWSCDGNGYACRMETYYVDGKRRRRKVMLHRFILSAPPGIDVDHIHHNILDCRRSEMRLVTRYQNRANSLPKKNGTSRYKGVHFHKGDSKWHAEIRVMGKKLYLGSYDREEEAAIAYNAAALAAWGEYAYLNPLPSKAPVQQLLPFVYAHPQPAPVAV